MDQHILGVQISRGVGESRIFNQKPRLNTDRLVLPVLGQFQFIRHRFPLLPLREQEICRTELQFSFPEILLCVPVS